jgi:serine/threonine protein kinase
MSVAPGTRLGPYEILAPLGAGGMGEVYRARDTRLAREVAVKVLPERLARDPELARRFERAARSARGDQSMVFCMVGLSSRTPRFSPRSATVRRRDEFLARPLAEKSARRRKNRSFSSGFGEIARFKSYLRSH